MFSHSAQTCPSDINGWLAWCGDYHTKKKKKKVRKRKKEHYVQMAVNIKKKIDGQYFLHFKRVSTSGNLIDHPQASYQRTGTFWWDAVTLSGMNRGSEAFETAEWQHREYWNLSFLFFFFFLSLYSKSTEYILFFYIWSAKQHFLYERQMNESMNAIYLQDRQLPASYAGIKGKSRDQGMRSPYHSNPKDFQTTVIVCRRSQWFFTVPRWQYPLNIPVKELPSPCAWNFYLTGHCSLVGRPTWASGK